MREMKKGSLGLLLLHLLHERPGYGYELCERLRERSSGVLSFEDGAIYPVLHSFEQQGLVEGYWEGSADPGQDTEQTEPPDPARRGPRRRYYRLTPRGLLALRSAVSEWHAFSDAIAHVLGESRTSLA